MIDPLLVPPMPPDRTAERIRAARRRMGMSHREVATLAGIPHEVILRLEMGDPSVEAGDFAAICMALRASPDYVVGLTDRPVDVYSIYPNPMEAAS